MADGRPTRLWMPARQRPLGKTSLGIAVLLTVIVPLGRGRALAQVAAGPAIDPFQQRGVRETAPDFDPLPALDTAWPAENYPRMAAVPAGVNPAAWNPPDQYAPGAGPSGSYLPGPASSQPMTAAPNVAPGLPPTFGPAWPGPAQWQQVPPAGPEYLPSADADLQAGIPVASGGTSSFSRLMDHLEGNAVIRGFYRNDQRIAWSGMEETFGAEADLTPRLRYRYGEFEFVVDSEFWINQPYEKNPLLNDAERQSYAADFAVDPFAVGKLALVTNYFNWTFKIGKFETPFGRAYYPIYTNPYLSTNSGMDEPYIRTEVIQSRETGILAHCKFGYFVGDIALTNGGDNLDTNSSKALVARIGWESDNWAFGASAKKEDGDGSELIKEFGNYFGFDLMFRQKPFTLSAECIYDEYGFTHPGFDPLDIYWIKSIYYRDVSSGYDDTPCTGVGYYVDLDYAEGRWDATLDYGEFYPLYTGTAPDQHLNRRGLVKVAYRISEPLQTYTVIILENGGYIAQDDKPRNGVTFLQGFQFTF
jgi:hypothetical protein